MPWYALAYLVGVPISAIFAFGGMMIKSSYFRGWIDAVSTVMLWIGGIMCAVMLVSLPVILICMYA